MNKRNLHQLNLQITAADVSIRIQKNRIPDHGNGGRLMADRRNLEAVNIRWHLGFYGAAEIEFLANKGDLDFVREYNLGKGPLRVCLPI